MHVFAADPRRSRPARSPWFLYGGGLFGLATALAFGCTPEIGDECRVSTDCSIRNDRLCDTSQPGGYCTQLNCRANTCADEAACVLFDSALPGCAFDDRAGAYGARTARAFCMAKCSSNGDCRSGYVCESPKAHPWGATILDDDQGKRTCLPGPAQSLDDGGTFTPVPPSVCEAVFHDAGTIDASPAQIYQPGADAGAPTDGGADASTNDAGSDASTSDAG